MYQHPDLALRYIKVAWRMIKLYHLAALQRQRDKGNMQDIKADVIACAYEAAHDAPEYDFAVLQEKVRPLVRRWFQANKIFSAVPDFREKQECPPRLRAILSYYELDTFDGTCAKFGLNPTHQLRKLFSECCPKPELGKQNGSKPNHAEKVQVEPGWTARYIMDTFGVSRPTAWRAIKRGYFYKPSARAGRVENLFSAKEIMNALLNSGHRNEVIATLQVSENYSFYFTISGIYYRVSNHAPRHWSQRVGEPEWIDVSPAGNPAGKDKLLNSISSPQTQPSC